MIDKEYMTLAAVDSCMLFVLMKKDEVSKESIASIRRKGYIKTGANGIYMLTETGREALRKYVKKK